MRIALEGCDGTGKTTVAEKLANKYGCNIIRLTYNGDRSIESYSHLMKSENVVHDRTFISEMIYPKYFNRASRLDVEFIPELFYKMRFNHIKLFILTASDETILERIGKRGDEFIDDAKKFIKINQDYLTLAKRHKYKVIDTTNKTVDEIVKEIGGYLK